MVTKNRNRLLTREMSLKVMAATVLELPAWIGREVTGLDKYRKVEMVKAR